MNYDGTSLSDDPGAEKLTFKQIIYWITMRQACQTRSRCREVDIQTNNILNYDETSLSDDPGAEKLIFKQIIYWITMRQACQTFQVQRSWHSNK